MYMPAQIQLKTVKMVEIGPESDVPSTSNISAGVLHVTPPSMLVAQR